MLVYARERPEKDLGELEERAESSDCRALAFGVEDGHFEQNSATDLFFLSVSALFGTDLNKGRI